VATKILRGKLGKVASGRLRTSGITMPAMIPDDACNDSNVSDDSNDSNDSSGS
jgi:hypothetical protein